MTIIAWIILGLVAGFIASKIVNGQREGFSRRDAGKDRLRRVATSAWPNQVRQDLPHCGHSLKPVAGSQWSAERTRQ